MFAAGFAWWHAVWNLCLWCVDPSETVFPEVSIRRNRKMDRGCFVCGLFPGAFTDRVFFQGTREQMGNGDAFSRNLGYNDAGSCMGLGKYPFVCSIWTASAVVSSGKMAFYNGTGWTVMQCLY